ncbi:hypothetical protein [Paeniglutamicibacter antarcticus]|uniref:Uncharacterized protein n=1 Tax=Paeniglutamicibacter antarcticus TaxID=494023 RepID=A0ABP9TTS2_9MICC
MAQGTGAPSANPSAWRGPLVWTGLLDASYFLLAFLGSTVLLWVPVVIGAWGARNLRANERY